MTTYGSTLVKSLLLAGLLVPCSVLLRAQDAMTMPQTKAERSVMLTLTASGVSRQMTAEDLMKMPQTSVTVHNAHANRDETYRGVTVADLLGSLGLAYSKTTQTMLLRSYLRAQGTDNYFVLYSAAEVEPELHTGSVLVATRMDGHDLGDEGRFKLVSSEDKKPARWVRNLISLTLSTMN